MPKTLWEDGDPFDVLVIMDQPTFPGCIIEARPIGIMRMIDQGDSDDKLLAVPVEDPRFADITDISQLPEHYLKEIEHFFSQYKALQNKNIDEILNIDELSVELIKLLDEHFPEVISERYQIEKQEEPLKILEEIARVRACLLKGNELDISKAANILLDDFRSGKSVRF